MNPRNFGNAPDPIAETITRTTEELGPRKPRVSDLTIDRLFWLVAFAFIAAALTAPHWWPQ